MRRYWLNLLIVGVLSVIAACGGGGSGSSGSSGPSSQGLTISPTTLQFEALGGDALPASQVLHITLTSSQVVYLGVASSSSVPYWLNVGNFSGSGNYWSLPLSVSTTDLPPGTYTATLMIGVGRADQTVIGYQDVTITYHVGDRVMTGASMIGIYYTLGPSVPETRILNLTGSGLAWTATADQSWIKLGASSGTAPSSLSIDVDPTGLPAGRYTGNVTVVTPSTGGISRVQVVLEVTIPTMQLSSSGLYFSGIFGGAIAPQPLSISLSNQAAADWSAISGADWLVPDQTSGTTPGSLTLQIDSSKVPWAGADHGYFQTTLTLRIPYFGTTYSVQLPVQLSVQRPVLLTSAEIIQFSGTTGMSQAPQTLNLSLNNQGTYPWTATSGASWLLLNKTAGNTPDSLTLSIDPASSSLTSGTYSTTVTLESSLMGVAVQKIIPVSLNLTGPTFQTSSSSIRFSGVNGAAMAGQSLDLTMSDQSVGSWSATTSAGWLQLDRSSGVTPCTLNLTVDPSRGNLASGSYSTSLTISATRNGATFTRIIPVSFLLTKPTLTLSPATLVLGGPNGRDLGGQNFEIRLNTDSAPYPWTASADQPWLSLDTQSGSANATPVPVKVSVPQGLLSGTYNGSIQVSASVNGDTLSANLPVTLGRDARKLLANVNGVAFASMPGLSRTTRTLKIRQNFGESVPWVAVSDQTWLTVTPTGTTPGELVLTADPAGLAPDQLYTAAVALTSPTPGVANTETIQVGFWVGSTAPPASSSIFAATTKYVSLAEMALDPVRPYVYVHGGGPDLTVYNLHTGTVVTTLAALAPSLGKMAISSDGATLFVQDLTHCKVLPISLRTYAIGSGWDLCALSPLMDLRCMRTNGKQLLLTGNGKVFDADTGASLTGFKASDYGYTAGLSASAGGTQFVATDGSMSSWYGYSLDYRGLEGGQSLVTPWTGALDGIFFGYVAFNLDGDRVFVSHGTEFAAMAISPSGSLSLLPPIPAPDQVGRVVMAWDGRIITTDSSAWRNIWVLDSTTGAIQFTLPLSAPDYWRPSRLGVSGDGLRLVFTTENNYVVFVTIGP